METGGTHNQLHYLAQPSKLLTISYERTIDICNIGHTLQAVVMIGFAKSINHFFQTILRTFLQYCRIVFKEVDSVS